MHFEWKKEYEIGIKVIDEQHKNFIDILNELYEAIEKGTVEELLDGLFNKMAEFANYHFATEEKYFELFNYEKKTEHIAEHQRFKKTITEQHNDIHTSKIDLSFNAIDILEDWLINHLSDMDKEYVACFKEYGLE